MSTVTAVLPGRDLRKRRLRGQDWHTDLRPRRDDEDHHIEVQGNRKKDANETFYLDMLGNRSNSQFTKNRGLGTIRNDD